MKCWCGLSKNLGEIIPTDAEKCCPDINIENVVLSNIRICSVFQFRIQSFQSLGFRVWGFRGLGWLRVLGFRLRRFWKSQNTGPSGQPPGAWPKSYAPNFCEFPHEFPHETCHGSKTWGLPSSHLLHNYGKSPFSSWFFPWNMVIFHSYVNVYQRVSPLNPMKNPIKTH